MTATAADQVEFCRARHLPEVELVSVAYRNRSFPEHRHEEVVIGAIIAGAEALTVGGTRHIADAGSVLRLRPGEAHANATIGGETLRYAVLYVPLPILTRHIGELTNDSLGFAAPVLRDAMLHRLVCTAHATLAATDAGRLEQESAMAALARAIGVQPLDDAATDRTAPHRIEQARGYIDAHLAENFGLRELSALTGLSPFHLVRLFKRATGLSPLAYRNQRRLATARRLLAEGRPTIEVALDLGYADQSHFTRHFQRIVGVSPQRYARGIAGRGGATG